MKRLVLFAIALSLAPTAFAGIVYSNTTTDLGTSLSYPGNLIIEAGNHITLAGTERYLNDAVFEVFNGTPSTINTNVTLRIYDYDVINNTFTGLLGSFTAPVSIPSATATVTLDLGYLQVSNDILWTLSFSDPDIMLNYYGPPTIGAAVDTEAWWNYGLGAGLQLVQFPAGGELYNAQFSASLNTPEPASFVLAGAALLALFGFRRGRRASMLALAALALAPFSIAAVPQTGWIVGDLGTVLKTTDGGATWTAQNSGTSVNLREVHVIDANNVWAVGASATIIKTTNGGATWTTIPASTNGGVSNFWTVYASSPNNVKVSGTGASNFRFTNDGGSTWAGPSSGYTTGTGGNTLEMKFLDATTGWAVGIFRDIRKTTDGGASWIQQFSNFGDQDLYAVDFVDTQNGWVGGQNLILYRTTNGGANWSRLTSPSSTRWQGIDFIDATTGWIVGTSGAIAKSTDGSSFVSQASNTTNGLNDVLFFDANNGWVVGDAGTIRKTTDGGATWVTVSSGRSAQLNGIAFTAAPSSVSVASSPSGLLFDASGDGCSPGSGYTTPNTFSIAGGAACTFAFSSPQSATAGTRYVFDSWDDNSTDPQRTIIIPKADTTYTATFKTQHTLTTAATGNGTVFPSTGFFDAGVPIPIAVATGDACTAFVGWTGTASVVGGQVTLSAPATLTGIFGGTIQDTATKGSLQVVRSVPIKYRQSVSVQNKLSYTADVSIVLESLGANMAIASPSSPAGATTTCAGTPGRSFYTVKNVAPGAFGSVTFDFTAPNAAAVSYTVSGLYGPGAR